uniref:Leucine-rich repeat and coiled-coil domain-containing protein 1 n=1 Tax=Xenopus tropicalis TaxID=8364 RepID=F6YKH2_XENTR
MASTAPGSRELSLMDKQIRNLLEICLHSHLYSINLHCNHISKIEGLGHLCYLQHLDLSSNLITKIEGLDSLTCLQSLNLSCNKLTWVEGLGKLFNLKKLNLSYNRIQDLTGFIPLHGRNHKLSHLYLHSNCINNIEEVLQSMVGLNCLLHLTLEQNAKGNPVCNVLGYREIILENLPQLNSLDGIDRSGVPVTAHEVDSMDLANLDFLEYLINFDSGRKEVKASCPISEQTTLKAKRDTDFTTESDSESSKDNRKGSTTRTPGCRKTSQASKHQKHQASQQSKGRTSVGEPKQNVSRKQPLSKTQSKADIETSVSSGRTGSTGQIPGKPHALEGSLKKKGELIRNATEESTYRALVQDLDQERERRWKAEQVVLKLTDSIKELQNQAKEEKDVNSMAVYTTDRIKELLFKEKSAKSKLQELIHHLKEENQKLADELKKLKDKEEDYQRAYKSMDDTLAKLETQRIQQAALEMKQVQEAERKVSASQREIDLLRASLRQQKEKVHQLHELLTSKEQLHRKELEARVALNGPEFQDALAKEMAKEAHRHSQEIHSFQEKMNLLTRQYADLEDEFRAALIIEAGRFKDVKDGFDNVAAELAEHKEIVNRCLQKEKQSATLIQELTAMVKEQKARIAEITKAKQDIISDLKSKIHSLEKVAEEGRQKTVQIELLKQEKSKLISQLTAQESLIDGLKAERKIWGQELTQQGVSLAQDRGRLEAKIEVLSTEIESLKKQNERDTDTLRIKTKVVDDQTETIRKLKEGLQERDERIRKLREENIQLEKTLREQSDERTTQLEELKEKLERQTERKEEVKQLLEEKESELEDVKKAYSAMNKKWQDKAELLSQLETQVRQMKENFDAKERKLIEERDKSLQSQKVTTEKLRSVDDAFRRQLESVLSAHQAELIKLASDKQKEIEAANERVYQVEEEMRQLLKETANSKKIMEAKIKRLTGAFSDIQKEF